MFISERINTSCTHRAQSTEHRRTSYIVHGACYSEFRIRRTGRDPISGKSTHNWNAGRFTTQILQTLLFRERLYSKYPIDWQEKRANIHRLHWIKVTKFGEDISVSCEIMSASVSPSGSLPYDHLFKLLMTGDAGVGKVILTLSIKFDVRCSLFCSWLTLLLFIGLV